MGERTRAPQLSLAIDIGAITASIDERGLLSEQSAPRFVDVASRLAAFAELGHGIGSLEDVTPSIAAAFITADSASGSPATATMHLRRCWLRLLFRQARELGLCSHDPTLDLRLPARSNLHVRPLADDEVSLCRSYSVCSLTNTRRPAAWALAEATARTAEIPHLRIGHVDPERLRVWILGSPRTEPRWGKLSHWGATQLARRLRDLAVRGCDEATPIIYEGSGRPESRQASACMAVADTLTAAGLSGERDVRPLSVAAWAGRQVFDETGSIEAAALALGCRSLDRAARLIGHDWQQQGPPT